MSDRRAEAARAVEIVRPDHHRAVFFAIALDLAAERQRGGGAEDLDAVVKLLVTRGPVRQTLRDRMLGDGEVDLDRLLPAVAGRLEPEEFEPAVVAGAVAVHRAVQVHRGDAVLVGVDDMLDIRHVLHVGRALVVDHHVVALRPVLVLVDREPRFGAVVLAADHIDLDVRPGLDAVAEQGGLCFVVVATAAANQQGTERGFGGGERGRGEDQEGKGSHGRNRVWGWTRPTTEGPRQIPHRFPQVSTSCRRSRPASHRCGRARRAGLAC